MFSLILWIIAFLLVLGGIERLLRGRLAPGVGYLIVAALVGPGGVSLFT